MIRKAKIIATIGPSTSDEVKIKALIKAGMDVARLNFSHGTHQEHADRIHLLRRLSEEAKKPITILQDLQGPKLRVGELPENGVEIKTGQLLTLLPSAEYNKEIDYKATSENLIIPLDVPNLQKSISVGGRILLDDGHFEIKVEAIQSGRIIARVISGGILRSHKGVNLPGAPIQFPGFTEKDRVDLEFGLMSGVDCIAISFVRKPEDVVIVRKTINEIDLKKKHIPIIAKLERPEAIDNLTEILEEADGVMVARGDLAVETSPSDVPILQKKIIDLANQCGKTVITATQMLDSMISNPRPTRAEASDVANAIFDGTDIVMLSGETASGNYPVESVEMMSCIILEAEEHYLEWGKSLNRFNESCMDESLSVAIAARDLSQTKNIDCIAVFTVTGRTAQIMSKARPLVPILAFTPDQDTYQRLNLYWGVTPFLVPWATSAETMLAHVEKALITSASFKGSHKVVIVSSFPVGTKKPPNFILLHQLGTIE